jgi:hypothetical protein
MATQKKFLKRGTVVAVQLNLKTAGFKYRKWGALQTCKQGDWIVDNGEDVYTVDQKSFRRTYRSEGRGSYRKITPVWASVAEQKGSVKTKEGETHYKAGDYVVSNNRDGSDSYAVAAADFKKMYVPARRSSKVTG